MSAREAIEHGDLAAFGDVLAPDVVWIGLYAGELCRDRGQVLDMLQVAQERGLDIAPEVVLEREELLVVDPHLDGRHQVMTLRDGLISEVRAYPSREAALAAVEGRPW